MRDKFETILFRRDRVGNGMPHRKVGYTQLLQKFVCQKAV